MPNSGSTARTVTWRDVPKANASMRSPGLAPISRARAWPMSAWSPVGVGPALAKPVAPGSPPKVRAAAKSVSIITACGSTRRSPDPTVAATAAVRKRRRVPSVPGTGGCVTDCSTWSSSDGSRTDTLSSTGPSCVRPMSRMEPLSVSPTMNEAVMMAVPSMAPATTKAASPRRRATFRSANRRNIGRRTTS